MQTGGGGELVGANLRWDDSAVNRLRLTGCKINLLTDMHKYKISLYIDEYRIHTSLDFPVCFTNFFY